MARQISQLLIDIRAADNEDVAIWLGTHPGEVVTEDISERRMRRFKEAISYMFPRKRFKTVRRVDGKHSVEFEEAGRVSTLDQLSTGEKQIIFRGGFILRDLASIQGGVVLIDEPELSLHPDWQARILGFYERLLPQTPALSTQLIIATHSPFVVHEQVTGKVIILRRNTQTGIIEVDPSPSYPASGHARVIRALNVESLIARTEHDIVVLVEGVTDKIIIEVAWKRLRPNLERFFEIRPMLSDSAIRTTLNDDQVFIKNPTKKLVGLFDFDSSYAEWRGTWNKRHDLVVSDAANCLTRRHKADTGWAMLLPVPHFRTVLASAALGDDSVLSIELLFEDGDHLSGMIEDLPLPAPGATKPKMKDSMKVAFARHVTQLPADSFIAFQPIFERLEEIRDGTL